MSKRSRGQMVLEHFRTEAEKNGSIVTPAEYKTHREYKKVEESASSDGSGKSKKPSSDRFSEIVSRLITTFKTINNAVTALQSRRKQCSWDIVVESYQSISHDALTLDDLLIIISIWREAFSLRWQVKSVDSNNNPRGHELVVEIPRVVYRSVSDVTASQSPQANNKPTPAVESVSQTHMRRIGTFSDKVYALVDKALAEKSLVLDFQPDPSLLPEEPTVAPQQPVVASEKSAKAIQDWERDSLMSDDSIGAATYDVLAARAIERGRKADIKAELVKSQINNEESNKLLVLLPAIADTVRSLSRRLNRTRMLKKDCVDSVAASMHLKHREALAGVDQLAAIIPEFFSVEPSEDGVPAVAHINTALVYKEVRGFIVEYVKSQSL